jgi:O-antigen/teichoic acid export membrane protein
MMKQDTSSPKRMLRNTAAYMAAGFIPNIINLVVLPLYARYVEPADYGVVSLVVAFTTFLGTVLGLQLSNSIHRLYFDYEGDERKTYCTTILISILLINIAILAPIHMAGPWVSSNLFPRVHVPYRPLIMLGLAIMFSQSLINYGNAMLRVQERGRSLLLASLTHTVASVALGINFVVLQERGAEGLLLAMAGSAAIHVVMHLWMVRRQIRLRFRWDMFRAAAAYSIPIIPHSLGGLLFMYSDKYVASFFVPVAVIGLYEFADKISMVFKLLVQSFYHAISPTFMRDSKHDRLSAVENFKGIITRWAAVYGVLYLGMALLSKELIFVLFPEKFHSCYAFIPILMGAYLFRGLYGFAMDAVLFEKKTHLVPLVSLSAGILNIVANILLIPHFGMMVAAWTTLVAFALTFLLALMLSNRIYPLQYEWATLAEIFGLLILFLAGGLCIQYGPWYVDAFLKGALVLLYAFYLWRRNVGGIRLWILSSINNRPLS